MNRRRVHNQLLIIAAVLLALTLASVLASSPAADQSIKPWEARLESLKPSDPLQYYELGEEVADAASDGALKELARHLFALAGVLDPDHLGRSACLALSDLEENAAAKRRLLALASLLSSGMEGQGSSGGGSGASGGAQIAPVQSTPESNAAALAVAEALSRYRRGQGSLALTALKKPGATELLQQHDRMLPGGYNRFIEDCKVYKSQKPLLSADDVTRMLRFEAALLAGAERSWSSELLLSAGAPLIEVDPDRLAESLGVDPRKPAYHNGHWTDK